MARYKVVGECAHVKVPTDLGMTTQMVYKGSLVPESTPPDLIRHLLSVGLIRPVGVAPQEEPQAAREPAPTAAAQVEVLSEERQAARAKLPEDGSLPHPNAGKAVWVEAAVDRGYSFEAVNAVEKAELVALLKQG